MGVLQYLHLVFAKRRSGLQISAKKFFDVMQKAGGPAPVQLVRRSNALWNVPWTCIRSCSDPGPNTGLPPFCKLHTDLRARLQVQLKTSNASEFTSMNNVWGATWELPQSPEPPM